MLSIMNAAARLASCWPTSIRNPMTWQFTSAVTGPRGWERLQYSLFVSEVGVGKMFPCNPALPADWNRCWTANVNLLGRICLKHP
jgi:hypothetical protein